MDKLDHQDRFLISIFNKQQGEIHKTKTKPSAFWFMKSKESENEWSTASLNK